MNGQHKTTLPRWVLNTLQGKSDYAAMWLKNTRITIHEFAAGYETMILEIPTLQGLTKKFIMKRCDLTKITGRQYRDLKTVHCFECDVPIAQLTLTGQVLRVCTYVDCRVLLCENCRPTHAMLHQLAGDK